MGLQMKIVVNESLTIFVNSILLFVTIVNSLYKPNPSIFKLCLAHNYIILCSANCWFLSLAHNSCKKHPDNSYQKQNVPNEKQSSLKNQFLCNMTCGDFKQSLIKLTLVST